MDADRGVLVQAGEDVGVGVNAVLVGVDVAHDVRDGFGGGASRVGGGGAVKEVAEDARGRAGVATGRGRGTTTALGGGASCARVRVARVARGEPSTGMWPASEPRTRRPSRASSPLDLDERARTRIIALLVSTVLARTKIPPREGFEDARAAESLARLAANARRPGRLSPKLAARASRCSSAPPDARRASRFAKRGGRSTVRDIRLRGSQGISCRAFQESRPRQLAR